MGNVLILLLFFAVGFATKTYATSNISECLASAGINVTANLIERTSTEYADINFQWQERGEHRLPMAYLKVQSASHVQFAVKCGRNLGLAVVARAGGHGYLKYAYGQNDDITLVVDLQALDAITVNRVAQIATIGAGARLGPVAYQLYTNGHFVIPYGECTSVGISGYTLGGGHSLFAYTNGMSSDNVIEMEMVNANGDLLTINNRTNANLFWALRGAGGTGSFGIVTKFVYQLIPGPHRIVTGTVRFGLERFHEFYSIFQTHMSRAHDRPIYYSFLLRGTQVSGEYFDVQNITEAENIGVNDIEKVLDLYPLADERSSIRIMSLEEYLIDYTQITRSYGYMKSNISITEISDIMKVDSYGSGSEWFKAKSLFVRKILNADEIMHLQQLLIDINMPGIYVSAETFSGKIHDFDAQIHSAFVHRDAYYYLYIYMIREKEDDTVASTKLMEFFEKSKQILNHTNSYQNFPDDEMSDFLERYYGVNLQRLIDIKTEVDPDDFFNTNPQSIPVRRSSDSARKLKNDKLIILISLCILVVNIAIDLA